MGAKRWKPLWTATHRDSRMSWLFHLAASVLARDPPGLSTNRRGFSTLVGVGGGFDFGSAMKSFKLRGVAEALIVSNRIPFVETIVAPCRALHAER